MHASRILSTGRAAPGFTESLGRGLALAPQVGEVIASLVPARRLAHGDKVAAPAHEFWSGWKLARRRCVFEQAGSDAWMVGEGRPFT